MPSSKKKKGNKASKQKESFPSKECSAVEYNEFLSIASSLLLEEAQAEFLDCARYGELDQTRALLEVWVPKHDGFVDCTDESGSTALHKASANGHVKVVRLLLLNQARHIPNFSGGNTPLHWSAANGHESVVEAILQHYKSSDIDVLAKNKAGRSALTEGFSSKNTKLVGMLLEHDSAEEEKLLGKASEANDNEKEAPLKGNSSEDEAASKGLIHEFDFLRDGSNDNNEKEETSKCEDDVSTLQGGNDNALTLLIRELPIQNADDPFANDAKYDSTGLGIWCASLVMARWMATKSMVGRFDSKTVLELGAGCGVPGLTVGLYSNAKRVYITDYNPMTMNNLP